MNRTLKIVLMLIVLMVLMPVFTGCPNATTKDLKVTSITANGNAVRKNSAYVVTSNLSKVKVNLQVEEKVASYKLIQYEFTPGTSELKNTKEYKCYAPKSSNPYEQLNSLNSNRDYKLLFKLYESSDCSDKPYQEVEEWIHTYEGLSTNELISSIGGKSQYCNVDGNGNYNVIYGTNLFTQIAYSQIGYYYHRDENNINSCTSSSGEYNKYEHIDSGRNFDLSFIKWVANKADIDFPVKLTVDGQIKWAKENGRWYTDLNKMHDGDLRVFYDCAQKDKTISIIYFNRVEEWIGFVWKDIYHHTFTQASTYHQISTRSFAYKSGKYINGSCDGVPYDEAAVGFISMKGIAY